MNEAETTPLRSPAGDGDSRSLERVREHYLVEKSLATRLRSADAEQRRRLYSELYDELYARVPDHPQLTRKRSPDESAAALAPQLRLLAGFVDGNTVFMEIGAGDCALSFSLAGHVKQVYGIDVSESITSAESCPENFVLILSDGCSIPVPPGSVDVAYSNQLMEHLHPDDAEEQLRNIHAALRSGGKYICITPNPLNGPHDVSRYFDTTASGFHLKEYTTRELSRLLVRCGFEGVECRMAIKGRYPRIPNAVTYGCEGLLETLPFRLRQMLASVPPCRLLLGMPVVAVKP